jgi:hypothetical protein
MDASVTIVESDPAFPGGSEAAELSNEAASVGAHK